MLIKVKTDIGKSTYEFNIEEKSTMESLHVAAILGNPPRYCHVCKNTEFFRLDSNKDKEANTYVNILCKCGAKAKLGLYRAGGYFWHKFEKYEKDSGSKQTSEPDFDSVDDTDIPF